MAADVTGYYDRVQALRKQSPHVVPRVSKPLLRSLKPKHENMTSEQKQAIDEANKLLEASNTEAKADWERRTGKKWDEE